MNKNSVGFLKGNMGGNQVLLLDGRKIPEGRELETALDALAPGNVGGHQAGVLYEGDVKNEIVVKIVTITGKTYISMCGGLTQILGKALPVKSFLDDFPLEITKPETELTLRTDSGPVRLTVRVKGNEVREIRTGMDSFIRECYELGIRPVNVAGVRAHKVGEALCVEADDICEEYPKADLEEMKEPTLNLLRKIQKDFLDQFFPESPGKTFSVYDRNPGRNGDIRVIFPHQVTSGHIEPACGTGTTVIGLTMVEKRQLVEEGNVRLVAESGGEVNSIGGSETTTLDLEVNDGKVQSASFTHDSVEILASGSLWH